MLPVLVDTATNNPLLQFGIGGVVLLVLLLLGKEFFAYLKTEKKTPANGNGNGLYSFRPKSIDEQLKQQLDISVIPVLERLCNTQEQLVQVSREMFEQRMKQTEILIKMSAMLENFGVNQQNQVTKSEFTSLIHQIKTRAASAH